MNNKGTKYSLALTALILVLMAANLFFGSVDIPAEAIFSILTGESGESQLELHRMGSPCATGSYRPFMWCCLGRIGVDATNRLQQSVGRSFHPGY